MNEKWEVLSKEIDLIKNEEIKKFTKQTLNNSPDYFFIGQASSTGKYHPACTCKKGGLITHVKRAVYIVDRLCRGWGIFELDRDIALSAMILHDIAKTPNNDSRYTHADFENHPINAKKYYAIKLEDMKKENGIPFWVLEIDRCIKYHMGLWTPQSIKKEIKDYSLSELLVYTADYMAATKDLITPKDGE